MCNFKSGIVVKDECEKGGFRLLMSPWTESHSDLITMHQLNDGKLLHFARVEFSPDKMENAHLLDKYKLKIDEKRKPEWLDEEMQEKVIARMTSYLQSIIVTGDVALLIGGQFIVAPGAKVKCAKSMIINAVCGGTINVVCSGTINEVWGGTIHKVVCGGNINEAYGGTINAIWGGTINEVYGGTINEVWGGTINKVYGGTINEVYGGTINEINRQFTGMIGPVGKNAIIVKDNRKIKQ